MQWDEARLSELRSSDCEQRTSQIDISEIQADGFADSHPGNGEE